MNKTLIVGLTGGIGSGKTTIANMFAELGVPIYIADQRAKAIMDEPDVVSKVNALFEQSVLTDRGTLDRRAIREFVFNRPEILNKLNKIVHPLVKEDFENWLDTHKDANFVIKESAILFEQGLEKQCDRVILVTAPEEIRIQRVMSRDNVSADNIRQIIKNQLSDQEKIKKSDYVIENISINNAKERVKYIVNMFKCEK